MKIIAINNRVKRYVKCHGFLFIFIAMLSPLLSSAKGTLSDNIRITSKVLAYDLHYRVYTPEHLTEKDKLPTIYITDGHNYIKGGKMVKALDKAIKKGEIKPVIAVFVDPRDPDNSKNNRRRQQFFCNEDYVNFFTTELLPSVDQNYPTSPLREDRVILGVSFGGFNSGCFGLMATSFFSGVAMNSPAHTKFVEFLESQYRRVDKKDLKIYMSVGNHYDNRAAVSSFKSLLLEKGYDLTYEQNHHGHNWKNWKPLLPDVLRTFFGVDKLNEQ